MSADALAKAKGKLTAKGYTVHTAALNVTDWAAVEKEVNNVVSTFGRVDILVQAAGVTGATGIKTTEVDPDNFDFVFDVNVKALFLLCKASLPHMVKANYGRIINLASISGKEGNAGMLAYSASKAAVIGLTKVIGKEYADTRITCNCIAPAVVRTEMVAALPAEQVKYMTDKIPMGRTGELDEIAALAAYIGSEEASFTTAFCFDATGGRATY
jgi:3-oxoacyl-[acyl-carrier protein] reductase